MLPVKGGKYKGWFTYTIYNNPYVSITFNDGNSAWDNNSGKNYTITQSGIYDKNAINENSLHFIRSVPGKGFTTDKYLDWNIKPNTDYFYSITAFNKDNKEIAKSNLLEIKSLVKEYSIYPYLTWNRENISASSVTINFETENEESVTIKYGTEKNNLEKSIRDEKVKIHHITLSELKPDTKYWYKICTEKLNNEIFYFKTAKKNPEKYSFILLSDMQDGVDYNNPERRWSDIADSAKKIMDEKQVDFIVAPGDLISNDSNINWKIFFDKGNKLLPYIVIMPVPGNHETFGDDTHERNSSNGFGEANYHEHFDLPGKESYYYFIYGNSFFIGLDTEIRSEKKTILDDEQFPWFVNILKNNSVNYNWVFVYQHIPAYSEHPRHANDCLFLQPLTKYFDGFVDWDFGAHLHSYQRFKPLRYNTENPVEPIVKKNYGRNSDQGVGYLDLAPSGNNPEKITIDKKGLLAYPTPDDVEHGAFSEVGFTLVEIENNKIKITTYGLGNLTDKKALWIMDQCDYKK